MATKLSPAEEIALVVTKLQGKSDKEVLAALRSIPALVDEDDAQWDSPKYWTEVAYPYLAVADVAAARRLRDAALLLLERACYGDPGEIMRGLRHRLEKIFASDWRALADVAMVEACSVRPGTRLWSVAQLAVLDDPRARVVLEDACRDHPRIASYARNGLQRLDSL
jgi:hypothetical protein